MLALVDPAVVEPSPEADDEVPTPEELAPEIEPVPDVSAAEVCGCGSPPSVPQLVVP
ncbi:MAG: hypothetical protein ACE37F_08785 [Nannocystaceae bacterium]|nr:hypothetical protein [bacterium]